MGNKPSVSEGEDEEERTIRGNRLAHELANGGGEDVDDEVELPPPMKPIQEPIVASNAGATTSSAVPPIEENPSKREQHTENQERNSLLRDSKPDGLSDGENAHKELSAQCSSNEATAAYSGDESDHKLQEDGSSKELHLEKRNYVMQELIETEEKYVNDLALIVHGYMATMRNETCEIPMPEDLKCGKDKMVFGNIENIYDWHKDVFVKELQKCLDHPAELGPLFKRCERKLHMYVVYCQNKPVSEFIVSEHLDTYFEDLRNLLGHKLQICDLLIKPVQRIMKYQLLIKDINKHTERAGLEQEAKMLREAMHVMTVVPKNANDMMDVGRLQGFEGKITAQGKLLLNGALIVSDQSNSSSNLGKNKELHVFLFEQNIIFSESSGRKNQFTSPKYYYKSHIQVNKMSMQTVPEECSFILKSTDPNKTEQVLYCQTSSPEMHAQWQSTIDAILQSQTNFLKAIQSPIAYQNQLTKDSSAFPFEIQPLGFPSASSPMLVSTGSATKHCKKVLNPIHHANTVGIPTEAEIMSGGIKDGKEHRRSKRLLNGLFGNKHKSESMTLPHEESTNRRWSESPHPTVK